MINTYRPSKKPSPPLIKKFCRMAPSALQVTWQTKTRNNHATLVVNPHHAIHFANVCACIRLLPLISVNTTTRHKHYFRNISCKFISFGIFQSRDLAAAKCLWSSCGNAAIFQMTGNLPFRLETKEPPLPGMERGFAKRLFCN